jgi:hypothetical protein
MPRFDVRTKPCVDYYLVVDPRREGPVIGLYREQPITESVTDCFGRSFSYAGVAPRGRDGQYDVNVLKAGQFIVEPGLVYCMNTKKQKLQARGMASAISDLVGSKHTAGAQDREKVHQESEPFPQNSSKGDQPQRNAHPPDDGRRAMREFASSFVVYLSLVVVIHLLFVALHGG